MKNDLLETSATYDEERAGSRLAGGFLIVMGVIFLLGMSGKSLLGFNPWILAALLPVYWIAAAAYKRYRQDGRVSGAVVAILVFSLLPFAYVAAAFLGWNVGAIWPLGFIAAGVVFLLSGAGE